MKSLPIKIKEEGKSKVNICLDYKTEALMSLKFNIDYLILITQDGYKITMKSSL